MFVKNWIIPIHLNKQNNTNITWLLYYTKLVSKLSTTLKVNTTDVRWVLISKLLTTSLTTHFKLNRLSTLPSHQTLRPRIQSFSRFKTTTPTLKSRLKTSSISTKLPSRIIQIFYATFHFTNSSQSRDFNPHPAFRLLFVKGIKGNPSIMSLDYYFKRWKHTYLLFYNLFFAHNALPTFGSRVFKTEILALNWSFNLLTYKLFKYAAPFFIFEDESYGFSPLLILRKWRRSTINYLFLLELKIFKKFQHFFKRLSFVIIGLVPMNLNPWLVSYPIPAFSDSRFIQYYFLKLITFIRQNAMVLKFQQKHMIWTRTLK